MIGLLRNKRKIYVCNAKKDSGSVKKYDRPLELYEHYQVTSTFADLEEFGKDAYLYIRIKTTPSHLKYYHLGDRVYVNVEYPQNYDDSCKDADYEVIKPPYATFNECTVMLKKRSGK